MTIPDIPTDNLYKFLTVFGLILIMGGIGVPLYQERCYVEQNTEFISKMLVTVGGSLDTATSSPTGSQEQKHAVQAMETLRQIMSGIVKDDTYARQVLLYWRIGLGAAIFGLISSVFGFYYWYNMHQKFHDLILKQQAESSKST